ncbi:hypothetical protein QBC34DRAFT_387844 [Podospora aff. communis PSN243]|uniref:Cyanovirin-N domain-containing protein n=1 Tax=Podospora aff. communis PSN243 TaxID=3040156 RepID=A0AAV9G3R7_9PEZI|nr:hypothetical protein QBC34DRAFT_387844 [Podospora aff. communis PSN243]
MVSTKSLTLLALTGLVSAEYLAVIETNPTFQLGQQCNPQASTYAITDFGDSHAPETGSSCTTKGLVLSTNSKTRLDGCGSEYSGGWKVCLTSYGGNVHNGRGQHQRCDRDDSTIFNCPTGLFCWTNRKRVLKCQGKWYND